MHRYYFSVVRTESDGLDLCELKKLEPGQQIMDGDQDIVGDDMNTIVRLLVEGSGVPGVERGLEAVFRAGFSAGIRYSRPMYTA